MRCGIVAKYVGMNMLSDTVDKNDNMWRNRQEQEDTEVYI
jgi:hypothetical protein